MDKASCPKPVLGVVTVQMHFGRTCNNFCTIVYCSKFVMYFRDEKGYRNVVVLSAHGFPSLLLIQCLLP